ncbi:dihydropteroate synthase [Alicyclobacillus contaminans]|uniref:dihydropteroate synthase n=1 Tax=Alicyclobacillus contaminans TaxID=392016 RepID=UPI000686DD08|nr:dihydropteroate synthase [Alicyclobacillus contaminans]
MPMETAKPSSSAPQSTLVMGIVNVTPDSFSDGGRYFDPDKALAHAHRLIEEGADILDIGAESTRPGAEPVSPEEEWRRLEPVLKALANDCPVPISVDTYRAKTAARALELGVSFINDIWGGLADPDILRVTADSPATYIWMHNRQQPPEANGFSVLMAETEAGVRRCLEAGIPEERLWIDPGIGFGKTHEQNLTALRRLREYCNVGYPVLLGTSRKRVVGLTLDLPVNERLEGTLATVVLGVAAGVRCVRVHDVQATVRACRMTEAVLHAEL